MEISKVLPLLSSMGLSPDKLGVEKFNKLLDISKGVDKAEDITLDMTREIANLIGIKSNGLDKKVVKNRVRIGRNELCICDSGKKFKKCCGKKL